MKITKSQSVPKRIYTVCGAECAGDAWGFPVGISGRYRVYFQGSRGRRVNGAESGDSCLQRSASFRYHAGNGERYEIFYLKRAEGHREEVVCLPALYIQHCF